MSDENTTTVDFLKGQDTRVEILDAATGDLTVYPDCHAVLDRMTKTIRVYHYADGNHPQRARKTITIDERDMFEITHFGDHPAVRQGPDPMLALQSTMAPPAVPPEPGMLATEEELPQRVHVHPPVDETQLKRSVQEQRSPSFRALPASPPGSGSDLPEEESTSGWQAARQIVLGRESDDSEWKPATTSRTKKYRGHKRGGVFKQAGQALIALGAPLYLGFALLGQSYDPHPRRS